jgi:DNA-binding NtrC family response regulator
LKFIRNIFSSSYSVVETALGKRVILIFSALIVDDDPGVRSMLSSILEDEGYSVEAVDSGKEAIKTCEKLPFDVALVDINLPDVKGTELLHKMKQLQPKMVKIIITGYPSIENAVSALNEKSDGFISKPFDPQDLLAMIKKLIAEKQNDYLQMLKEVEGAQKNNPFVKYQNPSSW